VLSAFYSGAETAFFSLPNSTITRFSRSKSFSSRQVAVLLKESRKLLTSIIVGNTVVNVSIASLAALLTTRISRSYGLNEMLALFLDVVVVTLIVVFFTEITPKVTAIKNAKVWAARLSIPLTISYYLLYPITIIFDVFNQALNQLIGFEKNKQYLSEAELRTLVDIGEETGALQKDEKEMIHSIFEMSVTVAREIMVPRTDMICLEKSVTLPQVVELVKDEMHSRIPVYNGTVDNIAGILYIKDLLPFLRKRSHADFDLLKLVRPAYYVPEQKKINELLREYQSARIHMAIVVDEYGGTSGLVTLEDVIEEIVGEIQDEFDREAPMLERHDDRTYIVNASMLIDEINSELGLDLPAEEGVDTLAGFLLGQFGSVPKLQEKLLFNGYEFIVEKATKKRIQSVKIIIKK
jgi:gliding motility-associated protein GldE